MSVPIVSSELRSALEVLRTNDYISLMIVTAVTYDYVLTFSRELHYIWHRPWTWVSTMFLLVRYVGLCGVILISFNGSTFVSGPVVMYAFELSLQALLIMVP